MGKVIRFHRTRTSVENQREETEPKEELTQNYQQEHAADWLNKNNALNEAKNLQSLTHFDCLMCFKTWKPQDKK